MATSKLTCTDLVTVIITSQIDNIDIINIKENIRETMDYIKEFHSVDESEEFIRSIRYDYIFIIVTVEMINNIFARNLHQYRRVQSILLFDPNQQINHFNLDYLRKSSYKLVITNSKNNSNDFIKCFWECVHECVNHSDILLSSLSGCSLDSMTTNVVNNIADFAELWFPLFIDLVLELPLIDRDSEFKKFIYQTRKHFSKNPGTLQFIDEFEEFYEPHGALYYYARDSIIYRLINRVLRRQAMHAILDFRFFLLDIRNQLQSLHGKFLEDKNIQIGTLKTFYRGQRMSLKEIKELEKKHINGTLITTNSYFSTSEDIEVARIFAGKPKDDIVSVLFEITARIKDPTIEQRKPFARISEYSPLGDAESEVLFSVGSFFKIVNISEESPSFWIIQITFIDEDEPEKQEVIEDYRTLRTCSSEAKIIRIGHLLANHPQQDVAQAKVFYELMKLSNLSETFLSACTAGLGWLALKERNGKSAIEFQQQALKLYQELPKNEKEDYVYLYTTSYNCIGISLRLMKRYRHALEYFKKAEELQFNIPIDKYAMYQGYRNITSINIASIYKLQGEIDLAWKSYKKILAYEMNTSTRFHGHTYLTIAQAGLDEAKLDNDQDEYDRCSQTWKAFLDKSLTNMTSNYRRSIISGVLLLGFQYADNEQRRQMAMDYFEKVIHISRRFIHVGREDYLIVLKCLNQLARLNTKKGNYNQANQNIFEALNICHEDELGEIKECYESLLFNYKQQYLVQTNDLTPEDISKMILENPFTSIEKSVIKTPTIVLQFKRDEFAFGQCLIKSLNPNMFKESDVQRCLIYCRLKVAALAQAQGYKNSILSKLNDDHLLKRESEKDMQTARKLVVEVTQSIKDYPEIEQICKNNLKYLNEDFDSIINIYKEELYNYQLEKEKRNFCISEDAFSYIGHLYSRKKDLEKEQQWYYNAIEYFENHGHICEHTIVCFYRLVHFYEKYSNFISAIDILRRLVTYLLKYSRHSFVYISIEPIIMKLIEYFNEKQDYKQIITIFRDFIDLILTEPIDDVCRIDEKFKQLTKKYKDNLDIINEIYGSYLEIFLRYKPLPLNSYIRAIEPAFRQAIENYLTCQKYAKSIETYQQFIELIIKNSHNCQLIETAFKRLALDFETLHLYNIALDIYSYLGNFIFDRSKEEDTILAGFVIVRCKMLQTMGAIFTENIYQMITKLMRFYHNTITPQFVLMDYNKSISVRADRRNAHGIYLNLLEFCFYYRSESYENHIRTNIVILEDRPEERIAFIRTHRVDYKAIILHIYETLKEEFDQEKISIKQLHSDFEIAVDEWIKSSIENDRIIYWSQVLHRFLELQSIDDEYLAVSYIKLNDIKTAVSIFTMDIYGEPALQFNSNACRRYLRYVYPHVSVEERKHLEQRYQKHFFLEFDSCTDQISYEILPTD